MRLHVTVPDGNAVVQVAPGRYTAEELLLEVAACSGGSVDLLPDSSPGPRPAPDRACWWACGLVTVVLLLLVALLLSSCSRHTIRVSSPALTSAVAPAVGAVAQDRHHGGNGR